MKPVENERTIAVYRAPEGSTGIGDLSCEVIEPGVVRSFWRPSEEELEVLRNGGVIEFVVFQEPHPVVALNAISRAQANEDYSPV